MAGEHLREVLAFLAVARERSFTRAVAQMGVSQSALSHTVRNLEERLGLRLLTRTTRSVSPTEAGQRLMQRVAARFETIDGELAFFENRSIPSESRLRISTPEFAMKTSLWPKLVELQHQYPKLHIEMMTSESRDGLPDGYDAMIRCGDLVVKDMKTVKISSEHRMAIVASPGYLAGRKVPMTLNDLAQHQGINTRYPPDGPVENWTLAHRGQQTKISLKGPWTFNRDSAVLEAAISGCGLAYLPKPLVEEHVNSARLVSLMDDWCAPIPAFHLCYSAQNLACAALDLIGAVLSAKLYD
ncbi:LysR family transcriptional regulator [Pseudomonas putida]